MSSASHLQAHAVRLRPSRASPWHHLPVSPPWQRPSELPGCLRAHYMLTIRSALTKPRSMSEAWGKHTRRKVSITSRPDLMPLRAHGMRSLARQPVHPVKLAEFAACCRQPVKLSPWTIACLSPPLILSVYWDLVSLTPQNCYRFNRLSDGGPRSRSQRYRSMFKLSPTGVSGTLLLRKNM